MTTRLNKSLQETGGTTTLRLARGSPQRSNTPGSAAVSPDPRIRSSGLKLIAGVGITDFLEEDGRPTFILDLANPTNASPGPLEIIFANASLRGYGSLLEVIRGKADLASPGVVVTNDFPLFKQWALSYVKNSECQGVPLPSMFYAGMTWSCTTIKKRLRIISANGAATVATAASSCSASDPSSNPATSLTERSRGFNLSNLNRSTVSEKSEASDYFGSFPVNEPPCDQPAESALTPASMQSPPRQAMLAAPREDWQSEGWPSFNSVDRQFGSQSFDWTRLPHSPALPRHIQFARNFNWASTPLGPIEDWPFDLRAMCNLIMASPHPAAMYWGDEYIAIYNEAYILLAGQKHPELMGQSYKAAWAEIWNEIEGVFANAKNSGQATMKDDDCLFTKRNGYLEESYFSWSIIPLIGEDGSVVGLYNPAFEKTRRKIAERRMLTLREVGERIATARDVRAFWGQVIRGLEFNEFDVPFAFLYSCHDESSDSDMSSITSGSFSQTHLCHLEGTIGVPQGHHTAMSPIDSKTSDEGWAAYLREASLSNKPTLLTIEEGTLKSDMIQGLEMRGWGDECRSVVLTPIHPTTGDMILGFLVMGVNPRRPYDDDYSLFIQLLGRQLATSMASVVLFENEIRKGERAAILAALDRQELSKQLDLRTQEAIESETKFTRMAEYAAVGLFIANSSGDITYCNETFWSISRHPRTSNSANTWMQSIKDEDRGGVLHIWDQMVNKKMAITHEFRFKAKWQDGNGESADTWVLFSAYPERDHSGGLKLIFGTLTDISAVKFAEDIQKQRMEEAIENKRAQENFIDMTSHEMRNPLSAILQSADEIITSLSSIDKESTISEDLSETLHSCVDAANTISLCGAHQKRIVDDILTLSKLDSALLMVTPVVVQPIAIVQRALKMFEAELENKDIALALQIDTNYLNLEVDWVKLDPSRLLQVLINLTTNAIKFTFPQAKRNIIVNVGASLDKPSTTADSSVTYFPARDPRRSEILFDDKDWGSGEILYLTFAVQDTGTGLDKEEKKLLFQRFSQASPRTHVTYGGSGLGLFISRELTELQGGEIGVASEKDVGSTFAFYIKARRDNSVPKDTPIANSLALLRRNSPEGNTVTLESKRNSSGRPATRSNPRGPSSRESPANLAKPLPHNQIRVLIVEDNLVNQNVLKRSLHKAGFLTEVANHGGEALDVLKQSCFWTGREKDGQDLAVILMDLEMPVMDGLSCARAIRELEANRTIVKHVPIIAVTANARIQQIESAMASGMDDVVSKPFRIPELTPKIEELVAKSNAFTLETKTTGKREQAS